MSIDTSVLDSYRDFMEEEADDFIREILDEFYQNSHELLSKLGEAPDESNVNEFVRAAHTLKSTSATVGATRLSTLASSLEQKGKAQAFDEIAPLLTELRATYDEAERMLKEIYS